MAQPQQATPQIDFTQAPPGQIDFTRPPGPAKPAPDQFTQDRETVEKWAEGHKILGPIARLLVAGGQNAASAITDTPSFLYHAITDPPTPEESSLKPEERVIARLGLEQGIKAGQSYARGEVGLKGAVSVLPEALGAGLGQVSGGAAYGKLGEVAGEVAPAVAERVPPTVRAAAKGANKALAKAPGTIGGMAGAGIGGYFGGRLGAEIGGAAGAMAGRELLPKVRIPGEGFGFPSRVAGGPPTAPSYAESLGPVAGGPAVAPSYAESLGPVRGGPASAPTYEEFQGQLADMNKPAVADMSTVDARMRSIMKKLQKEKAPAPAEEDLVAKGVQSRQAVIDQKVLGVLNKTGKDLQVSLESLGNSPELQRFSPEEIEQSSVRLRDAGKISRMETGGGAHASRYVVMLK